MSCWRRGTLAAAVTDERIASGALYPPISSLRAVSRQIATVVVREAIDVGVAGADIARESAAAAVDFGDMVAGVRAV